jgi:Mannosylglycerate hydrolase MGH1-like glycoside hydrolase domain/Glycosyl hydrolase family 65, C-terminal domain
MEVQLRRGLSSDAGRYRRHVSGLGFSVARRALLGAACATLLGSASVAVGLGFPGAAGAAVADFNPAPALQFSDSSLQSALGNPYLSAIQNVEVTNTVAADPSIYNSSGLISYPPGVFLRAGQAYSPPQKWTRDNAVNSWNAASLLGPVVAANTLWAATTRQTDGSLILLQDTQWWDHIIWVTAAWNQYLITGDRTFLANAYQTSVNSMATRRAQNFNTTFGLFEGPGFMNDGIAGYPAPPDNPATGRSGGVLSYPGASDMMVLSTNSEYYGAYQALASMATELGKDADAATYREDARVLRDAINTHFWRPDAGTYGYFIHGSDSMAGQLDTHQEGGGLAFAILYGVASADQTRQLLDNAHWQPYGIVNVWPAFDRYSAAQPGRHNVMVWPMVHSMFGDATAKAGRVDLFARSVTDLASLVNGVDGSFYELYNSVTGARDGGWQVRGTTALAHWVSQPNQTWSATGYLRMIYDGLFGLTFAPDKLTLAPTLPSGWGPVSLKGLHYRDMTLDIELTGGGNQIRSSSVDGVPGPPTVPADGHGTHTIRIDMVSTTSAGGSVGGTVPATLALTLGAPASFGSFTPGLAKDYTASSSATVTSTAGDATLTVADPSSTATGHLVNGTFSMPQALQAGANGGSLAPVGASTAPTTLLMYSGPVANDPVTLNFKQPVAATDALRTGAYSKTLSFTLSTTTP